MKRFSLSLAFLAICFVAAFSFSTEPAINSNTEPVVADITGVFESPIANGYAYYFVSKKGNKVYMVGLSKDKSHASAFEGTQSGNTVTGVFYSLPFGQWKANGTCSFTVSSNGNTWTLNSGGSGDSFRHNSLTRTNLPSNLPSLSKGWFSGSNLSDMTGTFQANNAHRVYLRQVGTEVVFYSESIRTAGNNNGPGMASVFFGTRDGDLMIGDWIDLPMGSSTNAGKATFKIIGKERFRIYGDYFPGAQYDKFSGSL